MAEHYIGLDIGSTAVRAVRVKGVDSDGFAVIEKFSVQPMRGDAVLGGKIRNPKVVGQFIQRALKEVGAKPGRVVAGIAIPQAAVAELELPAAIKANERVKALRTMEVSISAAVPANDSLLSVNYLGDAPAKDDKPQARLLVATTLSDAVEALNEAMSASGFQLRAVDLSAAATLRALVRDVEGSTDVSAIVDVGATSTTIVTRRGLSIVSVRGFANGGMDLTRAIAQAGKESFEDAERRKYSMHLPTGTSGMPVTLNDGYAGLADDDDEYQRRVSQQTALEQSLAHAAENLVDQIAQAVEADSAAGVRPRHIALCGGTALTRGLKERLQRRTGVEVRIGHPWAKLAKSRDHEEFIHNGREDPRLMLSLSTATGLALWRDVK